MQTNFFFDLTFEWEKHPELLKLYHRSTLCLDVAFQPNALKNILIQNLALWKRCRHAHNLSSYMDFFRFSLGARAWKLMKTPGKVKWVWFNFLAVDVANRKLIPFHNFTKTTSKVYNLMKWKESEQSEFFTYCRNDNWDSRKTKWLTVTF